MSEQDLIDRLMATVQEQVRMPGLAFEPGLRLDSIPGYDSVIAIQLVLGLERNFALMLDEDDIEAMHTLGDVLAVLRVRGAALV